MLVLDYAGIGNVGRGVVDHSVALIVGHGEYLRLEVDRTVFQRPELIVEIAVDGAGVDNRPGYRVELGTMVEVVAVQTHFHAL